MTIIDNTLKLYYKSGTSLLKPLFFKLLIRKKTNNKAREENRLCKLIYCIHQNFYNTKVVFRLTLTRWIKNSHKNVKFQTTST